MIDSPGDEVALGHRLSGSRWCLSIDRAGLPLPRVEMRKGAGDDSDPDLILSGINPFQQGGISPWVSKKRSVV